NLNRGTGIGDEMVAVAGTAGGVVKALATGKPVSPGRIRARFDNEMKAQRATEDDFMRRRPMAANLAKGTGGAGLMFVPGGPAMQFAANASRGGNMARAATVAAAEAASYGLADRGSPSERVKAATDPAILAASAGLGALGG